MTRVHDMGGRFGDGPVVPEAEDAPVFAEDWHARALAVTLACGALGQWNIDTSRHARERLSPKDYTRFSYYEKWISALADLLVEKGVLTRADLEGKGAVGLHKLAERALKAENVAGALAKGGPADRDGGLGCRGSRPGRRCGRGCLRITRWWMAATQGCRSTRPARAAISCGCMAPMCSRTAAPMVWARRRSRFMRCAFLRVSCGRIQSTRRTRWCWTCGRAIWSRYEVVS